MRNTRRLVLVAIIGGVLLGGRRGPGALIGAVGGAMVGAAASQSSESRVYEVAVRFEDGGQQVFVFQNQSPFGPGEPVVQTPESPFAQLLEYVGDGDDPERPDAHLRRQRRRQLRQRQAHLHRQRPRRHELRGAERRERAEVRPVRGAVS